MARKVTAETLALIKQWEGFRGYAYDDFAPHEPVEIGDPVNGTLTIGYGHTGSDVKPGDTITKRQAHDLLRRDLRRFEEAVEAAVTVDLTPEQFGALVSFAFNVGVGAFRKSTLLRRLNSGDYEAVPEELSRWVFSKGKRMAGLVTRRAAEAGLWSRGAFVASRHVEPAPPQRPETQAAVKIGGGAAAGASAAAAIAEAASGAERGAALLSSDNPALWIVGTLIIVGLAYAAWRKWRG